MKKIILIASIAFLLLFIVGAGCKKDDEKWVQIDSLSPDKQISNQLSTVFSGNKNCLSNFQGDTVFHVIFSQNELKEFDKCTIIPDLDFDKYTLVVGKIMVSSISDSISTITLTSNASKAIYNIKISIFEPDGRYGAIGHLYFWRLYPILNHDYDFKLLVTKP